MKALFNVSFTRFVSPSIARIVYILIMVVLAIFYLVMVIASFRANAVLGVLVLLVIGPLITLVYLALVRVGLESLIAGIRTAENTAELVRLAGGGPSAAGTPLAPGSNPYYPAAGTPPRPPADPGRYPSN